MSSEQSLGAVEQQMNIRIKLSSLREIIREELYRLDETRWNVYRTKKMQRIGDPVQVDANSTDEAGKLGAQKFGPGVDPYTLDVEKMPELQSKSVLSSTNIMAKSAAVDILHALKAIERTLNTHVFQATVPTITVSIIEKLIDDLLNAYGALSSMQDQFDPYQTIHVRRLLKAIPPILDSLRAARLSMEIRHFQSSVNGAYSAQFDAEALIQVMP